MSEIVRCDWSTPDAFHEYHDNEWGRPTTNANLLFEKICLEGFQSGLSWLTILRKRENFRAAFSNFDYTVIAHYDRDDVERLVTDAGIIRHRGKIEATINNAQRAIELDEAEGSIVEWIWQWAVTKPVRVDGGVPPITDRSAALAKDLKSRGWRFFGPTTAYAFMQSEGLTNDHDEGCASWRPCETERAVFLTGRELRPQLLPHRTTA